MKYKLPGLVTALLLCLFFLARPYFSEPVPAGAEDSRAELQEQVFSDITEDFALFIDLTGEVQYRRNSVYPVALKATDQEGAVKWLQQGFSEELARSLACFYLAWDEELQRLVVVPKDSIPVLTRQDRSKTVITFRNDRQVRLECPFYDCYAPGDHYRYLIEAENQEERWKIYELTLEQISSGQEF